MEKSPCYKCENRSIKCHSNCEKYKAFRKLMDERIDENKERKAAEVEINYKFIRRMKKRT